MADQEIEMMAVIGKIAAALSQSAGHVLCQVLLPVLNHTFAAG